MRLISQLWLAVAYLLLHISLVTSVALDISSPDSIKRAAKTIAAGMMASYTGDEPGGTPGLLPGWGTPDGYYWWTGGGMFGTVLNYWYRTGDDTYNEATKQALLYQSAPELGGFFEPKLQRAQLGNDDIAFWAFAAMEAAEYKFPNPPPDQPQWLAMVQGVFNRQAYRWDNVCGGGLRWQTVFTAPGYQFKNAISNGCFFQLGARLGKYTGNHSYFDWCEKTYNWMSDVGIIRDDYHVYDGVWITDGCSWRNAIEQWSYNVGTLLYGSAAIWNATKSPIWKERTQGFLTASRTFLETSETTGKNVVTEVICELRQNCQLDASTFKAYLIRWLRETSIVAPWSKPEVDALLQWSAPAAAVVCDQPVSGGGVSCGQKWYTGSFDGITGIGENMNAMEAIQTLLDSPGPVTHVEGISKGDPSAGAGGGLILGLGPGSHNYTINVTTADIAGASIVTILLAVLTFAGGWWVVR